MAGWINRNFHFEKEELTCVMEILIRLDGDRTMRMLPTMMEAQVGDVFIFALGL